MPSGISPAVVLEPVNAALLAAKIIAVADPEMRKAVKAYQAKMQNVILADDQEVQTI
jgi:5-(carboxyamino)imidazole ribonucleotide mutase/phosphoribosylaminoimidazole-succinocarboxamide synthase